MAKKVRSTHCWILASSSYYFSENQPILEKQSENADFVSFL